MIYGYIKNNKFNYKTDQKVYETSKFILIIDGKVEQEYYKEIIKVYNDNKKIDKILKDFITIYLYNKKTNELLLIADRIGAKKIYYCNNNEDFYFANTLNKIPVNKEINIDILSMYFRYHYIPEPYSIYKNINKLEHGYYLQFKNNKININQYWSLINKFNMRIIKNNYKEIEEKLENKLNKVIKEETNKKTNIGLYLSSGIDSSLISALYKKISKNRIKTISLGFEEEKYNEANDSKKIAEYLKSNHIEYIISNKEAKEIIDKIPYYYSEPIGDNSIVASIKINEIAKNNNISFSITGDGSDQEFCGEKKYDDLYIKNKYKIFNKFRFLVPKSILKHKKAFYIFNNNPQKYDSQIDIIFNEEKLKDIFIDNGPKRFEIEQDINTKNIQEKRMILDLNTEMNKELTKICTPANINGIEIISPFLTKEIIEFSFQIPHKYKYYKKEKKYIIKNILYKNIPSNLFDNKKKGFAIPAKEWLKTILNEELKELSSKEFIEEQNIFNYEKINYLVNHIDGNATFLWDYYIFQKWYKENKKTR